jgi:hypothetical protein
MTEKICVGLEAGLATGNLSINTGWNRSKYIMYNNSSLYVFQMHNCHRWHCFLILTYNSKRNSSHLQSNEISTLLRQSPSLKILDLSK